MTPEQVEAARIYQRRYREKLAQDPARLERYRETRKRNQIKHYERHKDAPAFCEMRRAIQRRYNQSEAGKAATARFRATERGRAYLRLQAAAYRARKAKSRNAIRDAARYAEEMRTALLSDALYAAANRVVPHSLPSFVRDDVVSDLCLGVLEGAFPAEEMAKHVKAITARHRGLTSSFAASLDDVLGEEGYTRGHALGVY